jgi:hypothetical protein
MFKKWQSKLHEYHKCEIFQQVKRSNLRTPDHGMGEAHCNGCSEINHDIKRERKTEITWIKEWRKGAVLESFKEILPEVPRPIVISLDFKVDSLIKKSLDKQMFVKKAKWSIYCT